MTDPEETVTAKTFVPRYQKELWVEHADQLEMSQSEFIRTMVQAGRSDFDIPDLNGAKHAKSNPDTDTDMDLKHRLLDVLEQEGALDWDDIMDELIDDIESDLDETIQELQVNNRILYSGRQGGYILTDNE